MTRKHNLPLLPILGLALMPMLADCGVNMAPKTASSPTNATVKVSAQSSANQDDEVYVAAFFSPTDNIQSIDNGANEIVAFPSILSNEGGAYERTSGIFKAPVPGYYQVNASILYVAASWPDSSANFCALGLTKDIDAGGQGVAPGLAKGATSLALGTGFIAPSLTMSCSASISYVVKLDSGEQIAVATVQNSGTKLKLNTLLSGFNYLTIKLLNTASQ